MWPPGLVATGRKAREAWEDARHLGSERWGFSNVERQRLRLTRAGVLAVALTLVLVAGGTAAYSLAGRRDPAAAQVRPPKPLGVTLEVALSPNTLRYGATTRVVGVLADERGEPLSGRSVEVLVARTDAPDRPSVVATPSADGRGRVTASFRPAAGSLVWLRFPGADGLTEAVSARVRLAVAPKVGVAARTVRSGGRWTTTLRGVVTPAKAGSPVRLDRRVGAAWRPVATGKVGKGGAYSFSVTTASPGTYRYRVVRPTAGAFAAGTAERAVTIVRPKPRVAPGRPGNGGPGRLLVTGDSFAYYLGQQLAAQRKPRITTVESRHSSGLSRPDFFDWTARARVQVKTAPGGVVVFLGANDCQPIRVGGTGRWVTVGSDPWAAEYRRRAAELMRTYVGNAARSVLWVGLPIVAKPDIAACYRTMNAATRAAARDVRGVTWVDSWAIYAVDGRYSEYVDGVLARQEDGIHLTFEGTRLLTRRVFALLRP